MRMLPMTTDLSGEIRAVASLSVRLCMFHSFPTTGVSAMARW
jgi:hypothetical protein